MVRSLTGVRPAEPQDAERVHALWVAALVDLPAPDCSTRSITRERLEQQLARPGVHTFVAQHDDDVVGLLVATTSALSPLSDAMCVTVEVLYVVPGMRGRGVGRLLLGRVSLLAEQLGASHVASNVPGQARELNRFFARLGFTSTVVRRTCTPAVLRARPPRRRGRAPRGAGRGPAPG